MTVTTKELYAFNLQVPILNSGTQY
jgi:hypothetical protein